MLSVIMFNADMQSVGAPLSHLPQCQLDKASGGGHSERVMAPPHIQKLGSLSPSKIS
jgi:hypothetical protein